MKLWKSNSLFYYGEIEGYSTDPGFTRIEKNEIIRELENTTGIIVKGIRCHIPLSSFIKTNLTQTGTASDPADNIVNITGDVDVSAFRNDDGQVRDAVLDASDRLIVGDISAGSQTNDVKVTMDGEQLTELNSSDILTSLQKIDDLQSALKSVDTDELIARITDSAGAEINPAKEDGNLASALTALQLIDDIIGTNDSAAPSKSAQLGYKAESTIPTEVDDGDAVPAWADTFGRQIIAGFSQAMNALEVQEISPSQLITLQSTLLDAVTATGASSSIDVTNYNKYTFHIVASSVSTGGTVKIQTSIDGTNWYDKDEHIISADGAYETAVSDEKNIYVRANITSRTDGTYTVKMIAGN